MSISSEIERIAGSRDDAYAAVAEKGGTVPAQATMSNLPGAIRSIGGGKKVEVQWRTLSSNQTTLTFTASTIAAVEDFALIVISNSPQTAVVASASYIGLNNSGVMSRSYPSYVNSAVRMVTATNEITVSISGATVTITAARAYVGFANTSIIRIIMWGI